MQFESFIGIDVSKETIDVAICQLSKPDKYSYHNFTNKLTGYKALLAWLKEQGNMPDEAFFLMEHTGSYTLELCCFLEKKQLSFALVSPLHLQRSIGLQRGKNDKVDAKRIAEYAFLHRHKLKASKLPSSQLLELKNLYAFRSRLVKTQTSLKQTLKELKDIAHLVDNKFIVKESEKQLKLVKEQIKQTQAKIISVLKEKTEVKEQYDLICSVPGVGMITALAIILATNNFTGFDNSRKFASYCGVAPFEHSSGKCVRGRTKTSPLANRQIKALLSNCASTAIQHDQELKCYYIRKVAEGKPKMVVINAVRAKIINRIFATINRGTPFVDLLKYKKAA